MKILIKKLFFRLLTELKNTKVKSDKLFYFIINLESNIEKTTSYVVSYAKTIEDLELIIKERETYFAKMYQEWLANGYICFIVKEIDSTIGIVWLNNTRVVPLEFGYRQILNDKTEAALIDAYVVKNKRGKGVYKALWSQLLKEAKKIGIKTLYAAILNNNVLSFKVHYKLGMKRVTKILYYYRILWFNIYFVRNLKNLVDITYFKKYLKLN